MSNSDLFSFKMKKKTDTGFEVPHNDYARNLRETEDFIRNKHKDFLIGGLLYMDHSMKQEDVDPMIFMKPELYLEIKDHGEYPRSLFCIGVRLPKNYPSGNQGISIFLHQPQEVVSIMRFKYFNAYWKMAQQCKKNIEEDADLRTWIQKGLEPGPRDPKLWYPLKDKLGKFTLKVKE